MAAFGWQLDYRVLVANCLEACASSLGSVRMYVVKQLLDHLPRVCICQSGRPTSAAVEAAPIRNEWLLNEEGW